MNHTALSTWASLEAEVLFEDAPINAIASSPCAAETPTCFFLGLNVICMPESLSPFGGGVVESGEGSLLQEQEGVGSPRFSAFLFDFTLGK